MAGKFENFIDICPDSYKIFHKIAIKKWVGREGTKKMKKLLTFFTVLFLVIGYLQPAASAPKDTVVIAQGVDQSTLDPQNHYETPAFNILLNIYETMLVRNDEMKLEPLLATSWRLVNDLTWEFKLRKNVKFQNGEDFNAYVVKFSLERMNNPKNKLKQTTLQGIIEKIEIIDNYTIRIITRKPYPYLATSGP